MLKTLPFGILAAVLSLAPCSALAQTYLKWGVMANGGNRAISGDITLSGTTGQWAAGHNAGFWQPQLSVVDVGDEPPPIGTIARITRIHPNPFQRHTVVSFVLPRRDRVIVRLYDVAGRELRTVLEADMPPGLHEIEIPGRGLSSGIYFCRFQACGNVDLRRIVFLK
jgi:hypothetical protein